MEKLLPNPEVTLPYRPFGVAVTIYLAVITGFAGCFVLLNQAGLSSAMDPLLQIKGHSLYPADLVWILEMLFLLAMAYIFVVLNRRARNHSMQQIQEFNARLKLELMNLRKRETELQVVIQDLERFNAMATGREQRILDLKDEVNKLLQDMNQPKRYKTVPAE